MYQHTYFKQQKNIPTVRYLIDYNGYSEGWATYVEWNGYKYAPVEDKDVLQDVYKRQNKGRKQEVNVAMSNSLGFGGHNATIVFKKYGE